MRDATAMFGESLFHQESYVYQPTASSLQFTDELEGGQGEDLGDWRLYPFAGRGCTYPHFNCVTTAEQKSPATP